MTIEQIRAYLKSLPLEPRKELKGKAGVYMWVNIQNLKVYVGSSANLFVRHSTHLMQLRRERGHHNKALFNAYVKYGEGSFVFMVLEFVYDVSKKTLCEQEQKWMDRFHASNSLYGYNTAPVAGSCLGLIRSEEVCLKLSKARKGMKFTEEHKAKIGEAMRIRNSSEEFRARLSAAVKGRKLTEEQRSKLSLALKGRQLTEEHKAKIGRKHKGKVMSAESRLKMSRAKQGVEFSAEHKESLRSAQLGKKRSAKHCESIALGQKKRWERIKLAEQTAHQQGVEVK